MLEGLFGNLVAFDKVGNLGFWKGLLEQSDSASQVAPGFLCQPGEDTKLTAKLFYLGSGALGVPLLLALPGNGVEDHLVLDVKGLLDANRAIHFELDVLASKTASTSLVLAEFILLGDLLDDIPVIVSAAVEHVIGSQANNALENGVLVVHRRLLVEDARVKLADLVAKILSQSASETLEPCVGAVREAIACLEELEELVPVSTRDTFRRLAAVQFPVDLVAGVERLGEVKETWNPPHARQDLGDKDHRISLNLRSCTFDIQG